HGRGCAYRIGRGVRLDDRQDRVVPSAPSLRPMVRLQRDRDSRPSETPMKVTAFRGAAGYLLALVIVLATWAVGMPRFASPDEPAHVYKAYGTAHGELLGAPAPGFPDNLREFDGPDSLGPPNLNCYVQHPGVPASCAIDVVPRLISSAAR